MYDFANQPFTTVIITFLYSAYFVKGIAPNEEMGLVLWSRGITITAIVVALISPLMGAIADQGGYRKIFFIFWTWVCIIGSYLSFFALPGEIYSALICVVIANIGFEMGGVFCNAYLPDIAPKDKVGRISGYGWSFGYVGGLIALFVAMILFVNPEVPAFGFSTENGENYRAINLMVALWFAVFSIPTFLWVKDSPNRKKLSISLIKKSYTQVSTTFSEIKKYKQISRFLIARLLYNDGLITIFSFGGIYAQSVFNFSLSDIIVFGIVLNITAGLGAFLFGFLDDRIGAKKTIQISNIGLVVACIIAVVAPNSDLFSTGTIIYLNHQLNIFIYKAPIIITGSHLFWLAGIIIGLCSGPNQASSRSLMSRFIPNSKENEFFGFFAFSGKATAFVGPLALGILTDIYNIRVGILVVAVLVIGGSYILLGVDEEEGMKIASEKNSD